MRKIMFVGRSESGKTTIMQAMKGKPITYHKTQYVNNFDVIIDTPGEYAETKQLSGALAVYGCEADIIGLLMSAIEPFSLYPPNVVSVSNREVVGVVTQRIRNQRQSGYVLQDVRRYFLPVRIQEKVSPKF